MIIEVDCNNDTVHLSGGHFKITDNVNFKIKDPITIIKMLEEILNTIGGIADICGLGTILIKIDEDTRITIGEW